VQQRLMRHADIRTTMNVYGDIVTDEMSVASGKVAGLALNGTGAQQPLYFGGSGGRTFQVIDNK
jgi:hypothetical protein